MTTLFGIWPHNPVHFLTLLPLLLLWWTSRNWARQRHILRWHNAILAVSFWEEILFRGLIYGFLLAWNHSIAGAILLSSLWFGLFHWRNRWWANPRQLIYMCLYAGLIMGPLLGLLRWWSGDIYLGILAHFLNNYISMWRRRGLVTDEYLESRLADRNWFERLFS